MATRYEHALDFCSRAAVPALVVDDCCQRADEAATAAPGDREAGRLQNAGDSAVHEAGTTGIRSDTGVEDPRCEQAPDTGRREGPLQPRPAVGEELATVLDEAPAAEATEGSQRERSSSERRQLLREQAEADVGIPLEVFEVALERPAISRGVVVELKGVSFGRPTEEGGFTIGVEGGRH